MKKQNKTKHNIGYVMSVQEGCVGSLRFQWSSIVMTFDGISFHFFFIPSNFKMVNSQWYSVRSIKHKLCRQSQVVKLAAVNEKQYSSLLNGRMHCSKR